METKKSNSGWKMCPVSKNTFKHPIVLDCGHTLDKETVDELVNRKEKKCPKCRKEFIGSSDTMPINWSIVEKLDLSISNKKEELDDDSLVYTAAQARADYEIVYKKYKEEQLEESKKAIANIIKLIKIAIAERKTEKLIHFNNVNDIIKDAAIEHLKKNGYKVIHQCGREYNLLW